MREGDDADAAAFAALLAPPPQNQPPQAGPGSGGNVAGQVNAFYQDLLGQNADPRALADIGDAMAAGQSLAQVEANLRPSLAQSDTAKAKINAFYQDVLGQDADPRALGDIQKALTAGQSLAQMEAGLRPLLARSDTAAAKINAFYQDMLGQDADPVSLANIENGLAAGQSLAQAEAVLRPQFAHSDMGAAGVQSLYQEVTGRAAGAGDLAACEDALAAGQSRNQIAAALLRSGAGNAAVRQVNALYQQVLGRDADLGGLALNKAALAGGATPDQLRSGLAHSAEAGRDIDVFYHEALGRGADAGSLGVFENALAGGLPLGKVRDALAHSQEAANQVQALYAKDFGRAASPDELAGYEAAKATPLPPGTTFTVYAPSGATLASGVDAPTLLANLQGYVAASGNLTPTLATSGRQTVAFRDAKQLAAFAFAQAVAAGQDTPATRQAVQGAVSWLDQTGQAFT